MLVTRLDGREDVLVIQTYLLDVEVPFLCGKQTLENWNLKIDSSPKILEIESKVDGSRMKIKMIDTRGGHYAIVLEMRKKQDSSVLLLKDAREDVPVLFLKDAEGDLCSIRAVRKVHKINRHKRKEQMITAYCNAGWRNPGLVTIINCMVNDCRVCQKFKRSIARPRLTLPKSTLFNEIVTLDLKELGSKYILWMVYSFT